MACTACGTELSPTAKFCSECGTATSSTAQLAEYKQVTVLFADVARSMDIAASVGPERLREIMAELLDRSTAVVKRLGGTVDKFTGDGLMAVFGAPIALEDHALRACMAALEIQSGTGELATEVGDRDGIELRLRVGLNSGQVIAGEIGSSRTGYTAIGQQVGLAQRMEAAAPPSGVMLSESTAHLVENIVVLDEPESVCIRGVDKPVPARRLLAIGEHEARRRNDTPLVGRTWELNAVSALLDEAVDGGGSVVAVVGPPGIGKSRLVRETVAKASGRGVPVFTTYCESHTTDIPFNVIARLLRATTGIGGLSSHLARERIRAILPQANAEDVLLVDDLLGIAAPNTLLPDVGPDARRRRLTALVNDAALAQRDPRVVVIEDAHWIDAASESMLADFMAVSAQVPSLMLITYRPEYRGALSAVPGAQTIALRPLSDAHTTALTSELVGGDSSVSELVDRVARRAAGNPFFAEEIVRDLSERGVLAGEPGAYRVVESVEDVDVPANLQSAISARIDRLPAAAKRTLNGAAVIGLRFDAELLSELVDDADIGPLVTAEIVDQVAFIDPAEYAFRHPLTRAVAYESQLKSDRAALHRRLAAAIEGSGGTDEKAAMIAQHLEAAGEFHAAFGWHLRAATWSTFRNFAAAQSSWMRARQVADLLPEDDPDRVSMRIAPRALLCANEYRIRSGHADQSFTELNELCTAAGDKRSLAIGLAGIALADQLEGRFGEAATLASQLVQLLDSINDPTLTLALSVAYLNIKLDSGQFGETLELASRVIEVAEHRADGAPFISVSPAANAMAIRGSARWAMGLPGWREDFAETFKAAAAIAPEFRSGTFWIVYLHAIPNGVLRPDENIEDTITRIAAAADRFGEQIPVDMARTARGITLVHRGGPDLDIGFRLLQESHDAGRRGLYSIPGNLPVVDIHLARERARRGDCDGAIELVRGVLESYRRRGEFLWLAVTTATLVEALLRRGRHADVSEARAAISELAAVPTEPGCVLNQIWLLRLHALLAQTEGDEQGYREYRDRYHKMANDLGFEGHIAWSAGMV
ncbi:AAA family ATPase [Mycobacterium sp. ITM-2016-00318]|uniref:AAA family ATPase n=1 Tax=Mycobacterium sp. ITM-2016-00318 TaxID=2099693 RepID=UPI000CF9A28C|nr:adenylate/guanylate cyclase domain-containing protein [Mycobacterium sp. ITM-2016-00318]WNG91805.1 adenylate/guanylate cyclase domain-containing protein [Mycobacterium sp. ITM-2016-00318]